jgi:hypothetical protein
MRDMMAQIRDCGDGIRDGTYTMTAPKITGGTITGSTINNSAIGGTTAAAGAFTTLSATGVTTVQAGTVSAPAITTSGDTNTGIFFPAADTIAFTEGGTESMRIDSSGNVGIGTSSPATQLQMNSGAATYSDQLRVRNTNFGNADIGVGSGVMALATDMSNITFYTSSSLGTTGSALPTNERMRIDGSGSLLVGQTTAAVETGSIVTAKNLEITRTVDSDGAALGQLSWVNNTNAGAGSGTSFVKDVACIKGIMDGTGNNSGGYITFETKADAGSRAERMRITSAGQALFGATSLLGSRNSQVGININSKDDALFIQNYGSGIGWGVTMRPSSSSSGGNGDCFNFTNTSFTTVGTIATSSSATAYNTTSDYRLKENVAPMTGALATVAQLKPVTYKWKADGKDGQGFIAHELQAVIPDAVTGEKDAIDKDGNPRYQGVDASFLVATLTAAIQELKVELDSVKAELQTLKGN